MEIKRYNDFSSNEELEKRFDEIIDMFPDLEVVSDIFYSLDDFKADSIKPGLYKSEDIKQMDWCGSKIYVDHATYFNVRTNTVSSILEELYFEELIYPNPKLDKKITKEWKGFSLRSFKIENDEIVTKNDSRPCLIVNVSTSLTDVNEHNFPRHQDFSKNIKEMKSILSSRGLNWIWLNKIIDSRFKILVI